MDSTFGHGYGLKQWSPSPSEFKLTIANAGLVTIKSCMHIKRQRTSKSEAPAIDVEHLPSDEPRVVRREKRKCARRIVRQFSARNELAYSHDFEGFGRKVRDASGVAR